MKNIPNNYVNYKTTAIFDKNNVPKMFLHLHNTKLIKFFPTQRELKGLEARH